jgi:hypothetical protein
LFFNWIYKIACDLEESRLAPVLPVMRTLPPNYIISINSWTFVTFFY